jgi:RHS repeat-associated protein
LQTTICTGTGGSTQSNNYPLYDGNGNVTDYVSQAGTTVASYKYDAFGNTHTSSGTLVNSFNYRFSTKIRDVETGLYYYGYRYYNTTTGKWINRDPIEETGGVNVYGFVGNNGINTLDILGLYEGGGDGACEPGKVKDKKCLDDCFEDYKKKNKSVLSGIGSRAAGWAAGGATAGGRGVPWGCS